MDFDIIHNMPLTAEVKKDIIKKYQNTDSDTGSPEVQVALLSTRINRLVEHLKDHGHDVHSRRGLLSMVAKRRRLINFLKKIDENRAKELSTKVGLKN